MKKWETPDMMTLNVNETAMGGDSWTTIDAKWRENGEARASFGKLTESGKKVSEGSEEE